VTILLDRDRHPDLARASSVLSLAIIADLSLVRLNLNITASIFLDRSGAGRADSPDRNLCSNVHTVWTLPSPVSFGN